MNIFHHIHCLTIKKEALSPFFPAAKTALVVSPRTAF